MARVTRLAAGLGLRWAGRQQLRAVGVALRPAVAPRPTTLWRPSPRHRGMASTPQDPPPQPAAEADGTAAAGSDSDATAAEDSDSGSEWPWLTKHLSHKKRDAHDPRFVGSTQTVPSFDVVRWRRHLQEQEAPPASAASKTHFVPAVTVRDMFNARLHLGHKAGMWNPRIKPFLHGTLGGMHVFDLDKTRPFLTRALEVVGAIARAEGAILFVGTQPNVSAKIKKAAEVCGQFFVDKKWIGGTLTNRHHTLISDRLPDLMIVFDVSNAHVPLAEANKMNVPTLGLVDSDCDPMAVTYPVPGNDDSKESILFFLNLVVTTIQRAQADHGSAEQLAEQEEEVYRASGLLESVETDTTSPEAQHFTTVRTALREIYSGHDVVELHRAAANRVAAFEGTQHSGPVAAVLKTLD